MCLIFCPTISGTASVWLFWRSFVCHLFCPTISGTASVWRLFVLLIFCPTISGTTPVWLFQRLFVNESITRVITFWTISSTVSFTDYLLSLTKHIRCCLQFVGAHFFFKILIALTVQLLSFIVFMRCFALSTSCSDCQSPLVPKTKYHWSFFFFHFYPLLLNVFTFFVRLQLVSYSTVYSEILARILFSQ